MTPMEGALYLGAKNVFYVPMGIPTDMEKKNRGLVACNQVGWSLESTEYNDDRVHLLCEQAKKFPNITRGVYDDFFNEENTKSNYLIYTPERVAHIKKIMHAGEKPLQVWMVWYTRLFDNGVDTAPYMEHMDGITMWFWNEKDVVNMEKRLEHFFSHTEGKRRMIGCYLFNFDDKVQATPSLVTHQLDRYRALLMEGKIEGIILHTNACGDLGFEAVEAARKWVMEHADEDVPDLVKPEKAFC